MLGAVGAVSWHTSHAHRPGLLGYTCTHRTQCFGVRSSPGTVVMGGGIFMMLLRVTLFGTGANPSARERGLPSTTAHVVEGAC